MDLLNGIAYNFRGLGLGLKTPKLFFLGLARFAAIVIVTLISAGLILTYSQEIMDLIWAKPESQWVLWLWYLISWLILIILIGVSAIISYLISQILFNVIIMDLMSRITERMITGTTTGPENVSFFKQLSYLVSQEFPRAIAPVLLVLVIMVIGLFTPLGPILAIISSGIAVIFLAWDNTDLIPARRMIPFNERFKYLRKSLLFHLGFGLPFLIPILNILLLSYAPVGATLYYLEKVDKIAVQP
ncbi:EI24 domain-containing protein [Thermodesulfobacteriota bacterium]